MKIGRSLLTIALLGIASCLCTPASAQWDRGRNGGHEMRQAENIGYEDGVNDGRHDRETGHSFRPTHDDNYKNATRGYNSSFGSKLAYKDTYRRGYERGYQEGYNRGGRYGRR